ncbi:MAG: hypothetical protein EOO88_01095 [Pedobacter sp.]|nr:MAG: hypothetical protein EOO88_01095 [Pedobacter sp.]
MNYIMISVLLTGYLVVLPVTIAASAIVVEKPQVPLRIRILVFSYIIPLIVSGVIWWFNRYFSGPDILFILVMIFLLGLFRDPGYISAVTKVDGQVRISYLSPLMIENELLLPADGQSSFRYIKRGWFNRPFNSLRVDRDNKTRYFIVTDAGQKDQCLKLSVRESGNGMSPIPAT